MENIWDFLTTTKHYLCFTFLAWVDFFTHIMMNKRLRIKIFHNFGVASNFDLIIEAVYSDRGLCDSLFTFKCCSEILSGILSERWMG